VIRLALRVRRADAEVALAELLELAPGGVEEVDPDPAHPWVEYAIYGAPGELPALPDLHAAAGDALVEVSTTEVADDWGERWKAFHAPVEAAGLYVRPPWSPPRSEDDVVIDPGQAFGTGGHATTRLCLELLAALEPTATFADLGCGSGVLAIAAARLGFADVVALDFDPLAVAATEANAHVNGVELEVRRWDLRDEPAPRAATVAANLLRPLLLDLRFAGPPATLIASGLLVAEADEAAAALAAHGLVESERRSAGEWAALLLRRPG